MEVAESFEVNSIDNHPQLLIATQGSEFKDAIVSNVIKDLESNEVYIKVIDVTSLGEVSPEEWDAILIIHVFEIWQPQVDVAQFIRSNYDPDKMVVMSTSASGELQMDEVDGLSGASIMENVPEETNRILEKIKEVLVLN
jgi:hypothetical protein